LQFSRILNFLALAGLVIGSLIAWPNLPEQIPAQLGLDGAVTRWTGATLFNWFLMPVLAVANALLLYGVGRLATRNARHINLPGKEDLLKLPVERQRPVLERVRMGVESLCLPITLVFCIIQYTMYRAAFGARDPLAMVTVLVLGAVVPMFMTISLILGTQAELRRQVALEREGMPW
jgi:uncharacterized membrane protein